MDSRQLKYFVRVVELGSLTRAAEALHVAQPALSLHMRHLEEELAVPLLIRSRRGMEPTPHGKLLYEHGRNILRQFEQAAQEVRSLGQEPFGDVAIGIPATVSPVLVRPLLEALRISLPKVVPHIVEAMSGYLLEWLHAGRLDAAILFDVQQMKGLRRSVIGVEPMYLVGPAKAFPRGKQVAFADLPRYPLIIPGRMHGMHMMIRNAAAQQGVELNVRVEVDAVAEMIGLVTQGFGYTLLARMGFYRELASRKVSLATVVDPPILRTLISATPEARPLSTATEGVLKEVHRILGRFIRSGAQARPAAVRR